MEETGYCNDATATVPAPQAAAPKQAKKPRPKARKAAPMACEQSVAEVSMVFSAVVPVDGETRARTLLERMESAGGVAYLMDEGAIRGVMVEPNRYDRLLSDAHDALA